MQVLQPSAMRGSGGEAGRVVGEGQFDADHLPTLGAAASAPLYPGILPGVDVEGLHRVPLLQTLPRHRVEDLARDMPARDVPAGQIVAQVGDPALHLVVVERGSLRAVYDTATGARAQLAAVTGPCTLDKAATLHQAVHTATWTATTACRVWLLSARVLRRLLDQEPALREHVLRYLAAEVNAHRRSRVRRAVPRPVAQVSDWLVEASCASGPGVPLPGGQQGLGEELGLSRVTVNRALATLAAAGAVRVRPRLVTVLDPAQLTSTDRPDTSTRNPNSRRA